MSQQIDSQENRAYKRVSADNNCRAQVDGNGDFAIKNISLYGTCLIIPGHLDKDSSCQITVSSGRKSRITMKGVVIWSYPLGPELSGDGSESFYETGFKFMDMDDSKKTTLKAFIESLQ